MNSPSFALIDTHCHLNHDDFFDDIDAVLVKATEANLVALICVGYDPDSCRRAIRLAKQFPIIKVSVGIHPNDAHMFNPDIEKLLYNYAGNEALVCAIGETGLDYYRSSCAHDVQQTVFRAHIRMAREFHLPLVIHTRESQTDVLRILKEEGIPSSGAVMHCLPSDEDFANAVVSMGCYVGIGGTITFKNAGKLREIVANIPIDRIVLETDAPYLAPHPYRGKRNDPSLLPLIAQKLAEVKNLSFEDVCNITTRNACELFRICY